MADAGGVVYLLSSYQSGKERQGAQGRGGWGGRDGGRESEEEVRGRRGGGGTGGVTIKGTPCSSREEATTLTFTLSVIRRVRSCPRRPEAPDVGDQ